MLYKTTVRPVLDYGVIIYDPCLKSESEAVETFQRKGALVCIGWVQNHQYRSSVKWIMLEKKWKTAEPSIDKY